MGYKVVSDFIGKVVDYKVCFNKEEKRYCAVKTADISNGKLTRPYRNFELFWSDSWQGTVAQLEQEDNVLFTAKEYNVSVHVARDMVVFGMSFTDAWNKNIYFETAIQVFFK